MESLDTAAAAAAYMVEDLLDFSSDVGGDEEDDDNNNNYYKSTTTATAILKDPSSSSIINPSSFPECAEEELEWLSNKDAFPTVDTFVDIITVNPGGGCDLKHRSPVSVLDNSSSSNNSSTTIMSCCFVVPVHRRARTNRWRKRRRGGFADLPSQQLLWFSNNQVNVKNNHHMVAKASSDSCSIGRKCQHCQAEKTPQWRAGPMGPKTLCNACGVRYKSGRLVPEYRPASSPTFSSKLHSNSHRKVVEMRKQKLGNFMVNASVDKG